MRQHDIDTDDYELDHDETAEHAEPTGSEQSGLPARRAGREITARERHRAFHLPTRAEQAASWAGWHLPELTGIGLPALAAHLTTPWFGLLSAATGVAWGVQAVRHAADQRRQRQRAEQARQQRHAAVPASTESGTESAAPESGQPDDDGGRVIGEEGA